MIKQVLTSAVMGLVLWSATCSQPADYELVGGKKLANGGYSLEIGQLRMTIGSGIRKGPERRIEQTFTVAHLLRGALPFNVYSAVLEAKGKRYEGKILSSDFSEASRYEPNVAGTMKVAWDFDEPVETLFDEGFSITFRTTLEGKPEDQAMVFEPKEKKK